MKIIKILSLMLLLFISLGVQADEKDFYDLKAISAEGEEVDFSIYKDKVVLITNVSSKCGTTPQLNGLQEIYTKYKDKGFVVLGFPSDDFGKLQSNESMEVAKFCSKHFNVTFPLFAINPTVGKNKQDVFKFLVKHSKDVEVGFNFEKFLVGRDGKLKKRYGSFTGPTSKRITDHIEEELASE